MHPRDLPPTPKALAAVLRGPGTARELLVFTHPLTGDQLPKGTIEPQEDPATAAIRELREESGLSLAGPHPIGTWHRPWEPGYAAPQLWHLFTFEAPRDLPECWAHEAEGSPAEAGLIFAYRWEALTPALAGAMRPLFAPVVRLILAAQTQDAAPKGGA
ncbi:NUDIX domain-containing protein [Vannielia litorea]|uniref:8-oxo-dGTP pyrophosphatase MutT, NUDIX family n=1 Tax=Vannielia litorea TaxID=1217970 RepID=A0A1N6F4D6_9RHOB|nr:NUDIX domain-containing protein [Vannielia litorea]SIN90142.1 8-oxo-dGTP pyrophosphatase MutT, NUDIX family [Vannielia litorea]